MPNVGTASVDLEVDHNRLGSNIRRAVSSQQGGITSAFRGMGRIGGDALSAGFSGALRIAEKVGIAAGVAGVALGGFGLKVAADFQQTRIAFEGILGSAEKAQDFLTRLREFAAKTPFEFPELAAASKQLMAVGFNANDVIPIMTKLGNVAATLGVGGEAINGVVRALGQMKGKGKASAEELNQISEQIPGFSAVKAIAEKMGVSTAEAFKKMETGAVSADFAIEAILEGMERFPGAAGAMERQSKTLNGVISTLKDTFRDALIDGIEPFLPAISEGLVKAQPLIKTAVTGLMGALKEGITGVKAFFAAFSGEGVTSDGFVGVMERIGVAARSVVDWFKANWPQIRETIAGVIDWIKSDVVPKVQEVAGFIISQYAKVVEWVKANWPAISEAVGHVITVTMELLGKIRPVWEAIKSNVKSQITAVLTIVRAVLDIINGDWRRVWDGIKDFFANIWDSIFQTARDGVAKIVDVFLGMVGKIIGAAETAFGWIPGIGDKLHDARAAFERFRDDTNAALRGIDRDPIVVTVDTSGARASIAQLRSELATLDSNIAQSGPGGGNRAAANQVEADIAAQEASGGGGDTESLPDRAHGMDEGPLPGPIGKPMLVRAHGGEWVLTPEQFESLASGRSVGSTASGGGAGFDYDRLAEAMARVQLRVAVSDVAEGLHHMRPR